MAHYCTYTDEELVQLLKKSDHEAFAELYERYWDKLLFLAGKKLNDLYEAEHIVQDLFLDLWQRRADLDIQRSIGGYLVIAVKYRIIKINTSWKVLSVTMGQRGALCLVQQYQRCQNSIQR